MNWKTLIRGTKQAHLKKSFTTNGYQVCISDDYIGAWEPSSEHGAWDGEGNPTEEPSQLLVDRAKWLIEQRSTPVGEMVKVNSGLFRKAISIMECTKGSAPLYLTLQEGYICLAYEDDGVMRRAVVACMKNKEE